MTESYIVPAKKGITLQVGKGKTIKVLDIEGQQVIDFFAANSNNNYEVLSTGVTMDCNESLLIKREQYLFSNLYNKMFQMVDSTSKCND
jgi:uncharacterized protein YcgI (DUF1989 family)